MDQGPDFTARAFSAAEHVVECTVRLALKAFGDITHNRYRCSLQLVFQRPVSGPWTVCQEGIYFNDNELRGLPGLNFFKSSECSH